MSNLLNNLAITKNIKLKPNEILGLEFQTGYKRYYVFGKDTTEMLRRVIRMYNWYAGTKHNIRTFPKLCREEDYYGFLYRFDTTQLFSFDDDCYSMGELGGANLGRLI